ncbi:MAG: hypothetical protein FJ147_04645 [Deltaproteobacteria bacterium]|nr:hypothetical protein [Deltaproteobacteria bacterium]
MKSERYEFPPFVVDTREGSLRRNSQTIALRAKTFAVLCYLLERPGHLVSKEELLKNVWAGTYVTDSTLTVCMTELRKALGDGPKKSRYITTVTKRGYRFVAEVVSSEKETRDWRLETSPSPSPASRLKPLAAPIVGRDTDIATLHNLFVKANNGQRQLVFVTGEPGIGKTTLVETFLFRIKDSLKSQTPNSALSSPSEPAPSLQPLAPRWEVAVGRCIEHYGAGEAYLPILDALGHLCRGEGGEQVVELLSRHAPTWLVQMPEFLTEAELEAVQKRVVGATRERMLREMTGALEALTTDSTLLLVLEDLHWSDYSTLDLLSFIARRQSPARLMIIGSYRPGDVLRQEHPLYAVTQELALHDHCQEISLPYLTPAQVEEYVARRFSDGSLPARLGAVIHRRTEGNPLFVVTVANEILEQGVIVQRGEQWEIVGNEENREVPVGLRQFIEQQLERVGTEERAVLEAASVVGMEFPIPAVAAALEKTPAEIERQCEALSRRRQFVQAHDVSTWPDRTITVRYSFRHTLYQEVLLRRLSPTQRLHLHRRIGERIEQAYNNKTQEVATVLAYHFEQGHDPHRARHYHEHAARHAQQRAAHREAAHHFLRVIEMLNVLPESAERDQDELMLQVSLAAPLLHSKGYAVPEAEHCFERIRELCQRLGEQPQLVVAFVGLFRFHFCRAEFDLAEKFSASLVQQVQPYSSPSLTQGSLLTVAMVSLMRGHFTVAHQQFVLCSDVRDLEEQRLFASLHGEDPIGASLGYLALTLWHLGHYDQARSTMGEALHWASTLGHPQSTAIVHSLAASLYKSLRDPETVKTHLQALLKIATDYDLDLWTTFGAVIEGWLAVQHGQPKEGIARIQHGLSLYHTFGFKLVEPEALAALAEAYLDLGQPEAGLQAIASAIAQVEQSGQQSLEAELYRLAGELTLQKASQSAKVKVQSAKISDSRSSACNPQSSSAPQTPSLKPLVPMEVMEEAERAFHKAIHIAPQQQAKSLELRAVMSLARLRQQQFLQSESRNTQHATRNTQHDTCSTLTEAHRMLAELYAWFTEGFDTPDLREAKTLLEEL